MEQNNNIIGYDPQTGQPIYANQNNQSTQVQNMNAQMQQPAQPQMQSMNTQMQQPAQPQMQSMNTQMQQPAQPQMQSMNTQQIQQPNTPEKKKNNKIWIIILIFAAIVIIAGIFFFTNNKSKEELENTKVPNNSEVENNEHQNDSNNNVEKENEDVSNEEGPFLFRIEDVFTITGRGTVVTGKVDRGKIKVGDAVQVVGLNDQVLSTEVVGIEMFREEKNEAKVGDNAGIVLKDVSRDLIERGQVLATPDSIFSYKKFDADLKMLPLKEGSKFNWSITPEENTAQMYFRSADVNGKFEFTDEIKSINPGDNLSITIEMEKGFAMEVGSEFSIRSGGTVLGTGIVKRVYN